MSIGEYESPDERPTQWYARALFLHLLPKLALEAVNELSGALLHSFHATRTDCFTLIKEWGCIETCVAGGASFANAYSTEQVNFYQELTAWAERHNLNAPWLIEPIILALDWWTLHPKETGQKLASGMEYSEKGLGEEEPFRFEHPEWHCRQQSKHDYRQAVEIAFREALNIYLTRHSSQAVASGDQPVKHTRKRGEIDFIIRMEWFVLYQVRGLTTQKILERYTRTLRDSAMPKQVSGSLREMSALIGLPLRPAQLGRPKKQQ